MLLHAYANGRSRVAYIYIYIARGHIPTVGLSAGVLINHSEFLHRFINIISNEQILYFIVFIVD